MLTIAKHEIRNFFSQLTGVLIIGLFLILNGLILWVFKGPYNIPDSGFADLTGFFLLAPFVLLLLIPAITMRSFAEEQRTGTLELLLIKPVSHWEIVLGKFLGSFALVLLALMPTLLYVIAIQSLAVEGHTLDTGVISGSYVGLIFLAMVYTALGILASTLTSNQVIAFLIAIAMGWFLYAGLDALAVLFSGDLYLGIKSLGLKSNYDDIARGVIRFKNLIYFISFSTFTLYLSVLFLQYKKK